MDLLGDDILEHSAVVANCRMNRGRGLAGPGGYGRELGFDPLVFLRGRADEGRAVAWLDLCCGSGRALVEAARIARDEGWPVAIVGVDLVGMFPETGPGLDGLDLVEASLSAWRPDRRFDLITCVHGLHYVGDKLDLIARAASWLAEGGRFAANLDPDNLKLDAGPDPGRGIVAGIRRAGLEFDRRRRRVACRGPKDVRWPYRYLGADDRAGPNYTGQPAVNSHYAAVGPSLDADRGGDGCPTPG